MTWRGVAEFRRARVESSQVWWQLAAVVFVVAYCASLVFVSRPANGYSTLWDAWVGNTASTLPLVPVLLRVRRSKNLRFAWTAMAVGIALNSAANLIYLFHDQNLKPVPSPASSDVPYLLAYLAFGVGVAVMSQHSFGRGHVSVRLDGAVAGLALGAARNKYSRTCRRRRRSAVGASMTIQGRLSHGTARRYLGSTKA